MNKINIAPFLTENQLPETYTKTVKNWFSPLAEHIATHQKQTNSPLIIGINGAQGSGKSTLASLLRFLFKHTYHLNAVTLSIDDFYYTHSERQQLGASIHPLMQTRGVPGTHDIDLAIQTIEQLKNWHSPTAIPRFNKALDDRAPKEEWEQVAEKVDIIILEGWCVGATAQATDALLKPVNDLERLEDPNCYWRNYVNQQLTLHYPELFRQIDLWVMLKAPSFDCVMNWRLEQENKLRKSLLNTSNITKNNIMDEATIRRFIKHYQRITEHLLLTLPKNVDFLFELDENREICGLTTSKPNDIML